MAAEDHLARIMRSLERIDAHIDRGNELFARNTEAFELHREAFERTIVTLDRVDGRLDQAHAREAENRHFFDELLRRNARTTAELIAAIQTGFASLQAEIRDQREQIQANTEALLKVLDRLSNGGPQTA